MRDEGYYKKGANTSMATISPERLAELRTLPYAEYLKTPEWLVTRKRILQRDHYTCQGCQAQKVLLHVHHYTYARLGCEDDEDLVTLCEVCHDELHRQLAEVPKLSFVQMAGIGLGVATVGTIGIEGFLQAPLPAEIGVLIAAILVAKNSPAMYAKLKQSLPSGAMKWLGTPPSEREPGELTWVDRWVLNKHRQLDLPSDEEVEAMARRIAAEELQRNESRDEDDRLSFGDEYEDDEIVFSFEKHKGVRVFSDLLKTGWRPSMEQIYIGTDMNGNHLFVPVRSLWHIALAGATGYGKSSLMRLVMAQLCSLRLPIVLLNPHYMIYDRDHQEDWTPYTPYLKRDPMECKDMAYIETVLRWMVGDLLEKRKQRAARGESPGRPFFFVLDEFPDIKAEIKDAPTLVGKLLRQGRKYGIYLIVASQDYSVKTLGVEGEGGIRKCFRTIFYVGGDPVSVKELLNKKVSEIPENDLGQGTIMLKCATINDPIMVHVPYLDNESLYLLLGPTTYVPPVAKEEPVNELEGSNISPTGPEKTTNDLPVTAIIPNIAVPEVVKRDTRRKAEDIDLNVAVALWNSGFNSRAKLARALDIAENQADKLMVLMGVKQSDGRMDG